MEIDSPVDFDILERGYLKEYPLDLINPVNEVEGLQGCIFRINSDRNTCTLLDQNTGKFLLRAIKDEWSRDWLFHQYDSVDQDLFEGDEVLPFAYLRDTRNGGYTLWNCECQQCDTHYNYRCSHFNNRYREQLMYIHSFTEKYYESHLSVLQCVIPSLSKNNIRRSWCSRNYPESLNFNKRDFSFKRLTRQLFSTEAYLNDPEGIYMETQRPFYDAENKKFTMQFHPSKYEFKSSKRNIQILQCSGEDQQEVIASFVKIKSKTFGLQFAHPLSIVQAFAIGISTMAWK